MARLSNRVGKLEKLRQGAVSTGDRMTLQEWRDLYAPGGLLDRAVVRTRDERNKIYNDYIVKNHPKMWAIQSERILRTQSQIAETMAMFD